MRYVYLHGFASGPQSRKAQAFQRALGESGIPLEIPDLAKGDFLHLTISGQLRVIEELLTNQPAVLIGSSLGGYLGCLYASAHPEIARLVLLAPAFGFSARWQERVGAEKLAAWRSSGVLDVFHYGAGRTMPLGFDLYEDSLRYPAFPSITQPALLFHGLNDDVVPIGLSRKFASDNPSIETIELASDHELLNVLDEITLRALPFVAAAILQSA